MISAVNKKRCICKLRKELKWVEKAMNKFKLIPDLYYMSQSGLDDIIMWGRKEDLK